MDERELKQWAKRFALEVMRLVGELPSTAVGRTISYQLSKSGTPAGANYRAVCRGRSTADSIARPGIVAEAAGESTYRMELIIEAGLLRAERVPPLLQQANRLPATIVASRKTASAREP